MIFDDGAGLITAVGGLSLAGALPMAGHALVAAVLGTVLLLYLSYANWAKGMH